MRRTGLNEGAHAAKACALPFMAGRDRPRAGCRLLLRAAVYPPTSAGFTHHAEHLAVVATHGSWLTRAALSGVCRDVPGRQRLLSGASHVVGADDHQAAGTDFEEQITSISAFVSAGRRAGNGLAASGV